MKAWVIIRTVLGVLAVILGTIGIIVGIGGAATVAGVDTTVGRSGVVSTPVGMVSGGTDDVAVIADEVTARWELPEEPEWASTLLALSGTTLEDLVNDLGDFVFVVVPDQAGEIFVGVAPVDEVNRYLDGAPYAVAERQGDSWPVISVPGDRSPTPLPDSASLWRAAAVGQPAELPAEALTGETLVIMRPDASAGVAAAMRLEYRVPQATTTMDTGALVAAAGSLGGLLLILLGAFLIVGRRPRGRHA